MDAVTKDILSLKDKARKLVCDWLQQYCRTNLSEILAAKAVPCQEEELREAFLIGGVLMRTDCRDTRCHLLYVDILLAKGEIGTWLTDSQLSIISECSFWMTPRPYAL